MTGPVLVTGATGHIGRFLLNELVRHGHDVIATSRRDQPPLDGVRWIRLDLSDTSQAADLTAAAAGADTVVHLAAGIFPGWDASRLPEAERANLRPVANLIAHMGRPMRLILVSTTEVFAPTTSTPIDEASPVRPGSAYALTKLLAEELARHAARLEGDLDVVVLRLANTYGPGESISRASTMFLDLARTGEPIHVDAGGNDQRCYIYVADAVRIIRRFVEAPRLDTHREDPVFIVASPERFSIAQLADLANAIHGDRSRVDLVVAPQPRRERSYVYSIGKLEAAIGSQSFVPLATGLRASAAARSRHAYVDLDGTVLDVRARLYELHRAAMGAIGREPMGRVDYVTGKRSGIPEPALLPPLSEADATTYGAFRREGIESPEMLALDVPLPGAAAAILALHDDGWSVDLVTKRTHPDRVANQLRNLGLESLFRRVIVGDKEDPGFATDIEPGVMIGDTPVDVTFARQRGLVAVTVTSGVRDRATLEQAVPDFIVHDLVEAVFLLTGALVRDDAT